jgi:CRP/FNR family transcriptional regulator
MAEILGVTPESVSRIPAGFKRTHVLQRQTNPLRTIFRLDAERVRRESPE